MSHFVLGVASDTPFKDSSNSIIAVTKFDTTRVLNTTISTEKGPKKIKTTYQKKRTELNKLLLKENVEYNTLR
jgi:hypothetical protein